MKTATWTAWLWLLVGALSACTTTGEGRGEMPGDKAETVRFQWTSTDGGMSGTMTANAPGAVFQGRFFQITQQTRSEVLTPLWAHWRPGWHDWPYWSGPWPPAYEATRFITHYSGKVVATLESPDKQRMRCRFHLVSPATGMAGGGEGECQLSDGRHLSATFAKQ